LIPTILAMRDLKRLGVKRTQSFIDKIVALLPQVPTDQVPAVFYQLLLFGRGNETGEASKEAAQTTVAVFNGIIGYFSTLEGMDMDKAAMDADRSVSQTSRKLESQCATHIVLALKHNQTLASEFLKHVKKLARGALPRFALMILLSMTESFRFGTIVPPLIKANILARLANAEVFKTNGGATPGLLAVSCERLESSFEELVSGFSFEAEAALRSLIGLSLDMLTWNGTKFQKDRLSCLSSIIIRALFNHHCYARQELLARVVEHLCFQDSEQLALILVEFHRTDSKLVESSICDRYNLLITGKAWIRLSAITLKSNLARIRMELLSSDDDRVSAGLEVIKAALMLKAKDSDAWALVRFAIDRLQGRKPVYSFLDGIKSLEISSMMSYPHEQILVKRIVGTNKEWIWPRMVSACVDTQLCEIKTHLPNLLLTLADHDETSACFKSLIIILDNQAGVRWFQEDESVAGQELKHPMIADLYEVAVIASLTGVLINVPRAFRLLNRQKDFISTWSTVFRSSLSVSTKLIGKALGTLVQDGLQTHGSEDLFKLLLEKLVISSSVSEEQLPDTIQDIRELMVANGTKLKSIVGALVDVCEKAGIGLSASELKWAIEQKLPVKDLVQIAKLTPTLSGASSKLIASIPSTDTASAKHFLSHLLANPLSSPPYATQAAKDALALLGEIDAEEVDGDSFGNEQGIVGLKFVGRKSVGSVVGMLINWVIESVAHAEWILKQIKAQLKGSIRRILYFILTG